VPGATGLPYYCTPHVTVLDVIGVRAVWRQNTMKQKTKVDTTDCTGLRARPKAQHRVAAGMLLNDVHTAIVQIDGGDEMDTEITIQYDKMTSQLGNSCGDQDETQQDTIWVPGEDVGQVDTHQVRDEKCPPCLFNVLTNTIIDWQKDGQEELTEILRMLEIHAVPL